VVGDAERQLQWIPACAGMTAEEWGRSVIAEVPTAAKRRDEMLLSAQTNPEEVEQNAEDGEGGDGEDHPG
jgi:hypothetical protein